MSQSEPCWYKNKYQESPNLFPPWLFFVSFGHTCKHHKLQILVLMPAVCSVCYHTFKHKYGLDQVYVQQIQVCLANAGIEIQVCTANTAKIRTGRIFLTTPQRVPQCNWGWKCLSQYHSAGGRIVRDPTLWSSCWRAWTSTWKRKVDRHFHL